MHPGDVCYYAQLLKPRAGHPTARVLRCTHIRTHASGALRLATPGHRFGIAADKRHVHSDPIECQRLLRRRIAEEIESHVRSIRQLKSSWARWTATAVVIYK